MGTLTNALDTEQNPTSDWMYPFLEYDFPEDTPGDYYTSIIDDLPQQYKTTEIAFAIHLK